MTQKYNVIGLMSGTSMDGLDICLVEFFFDTKWNYTIMEAETIPYPTDWLTKLITASSYSSENLAKLNIEYGYYLGKMVYQFVLKHNIISVDFISSHGHTIFHNPELKYTMQIGHGASIAFSSGLEVVCDFRTQDVIMGGHGAPLVPIGDKLLFSDYDYCLNLGGFANISFDINNERIAYDICVVNVVLNLLARKLDKHFDQNGSFAQNGNFNPNLFNELNDLAFYQSAYPKSLGIEWVEQYIAPILIKYNHLPVHDVLNTFTQHVAYQIAKNIENNPIKKILITGGGAYNLYLIDRLKYYTQTQIIIPNNDTVEYKEAVIFALLGVLKKEGVNNVLSSVTGAIRDHSSGVLYTI